MTRRNPRRRSAVLILRIEMMLQTMTSPYFRASVSPSHIKAAAKQIAQRAR